MRIRLLPLALFIVILLSFNAVALPMASIRIDDDALHAGDELEMYINLKNDEGRKLEDLRLKVSLVENGMVIGSDKFDLNKHSKRTKAVFWEIPNDLTNGEYMLKISLSNNKVRNVKYRNIIIL